MVWIPWFDTAAGVGVLRRLPLSPYIRITRYQTFIAISIYITNLFFWFWIVFHRFLHRFGGYVDRRFERFGGLRG